MGRAGRAAAGTIAHMAMTPAEADKILADNFAPWVLDLGLSVETRRRPCGPASSLVTAVGTGGRRAVGPGADGRRRHRHRDRGLGGPRRLRTDDDGAAVHGFQRAVTGSDVLIEAVSPSWPPHGVRRHHDDRAVGDSRPASTVYASGLTRLSKRSATVRREWRSESRLQGICTSNAQPGHRERRICTGARPPARHWAGTVAFAAASGKGPRAIDAAQHVKKSAARRAQRLHGSPPVEHKFPGESAWLIGSAPPRPCFDPSHRGGRARLPETGAAPLRWRPSSVPQRGPLSPL